MPVQIAPAIATVQQFADYQGLTAGQLAGVLPVSGGPTTMTAWISQLLGRTATLICNWLDYDYTTGQIQNVNSFGNNATAWKFPFPIATLSVATAWDPTNPTVTPVNDAGNIAILSSDLTILYRTDGALFQQQLYYYFELIQAAGFLFNVWPLDIIQVQLEMVSVIYRESAVFNGEGLVGQNPNLLGNESFESYLKYTQKYIDLTPRWKDRLRGHRRMAI